MPTSPIWERIAATDGDRGTHSGPSAGIDGGMSSDLHLLLSPKFAEAEIEGGSAPPAW